MPVCVDVIEDCPNQVYDAKGCRVPVERNCEEEEEGNLRSCPLLFDSKGCNQDTICLFDDPECKCPEQTYDEEGCSLQLNDPVCDEDTEMKCVKRNH